MSNIPLFKSQQGPTAPTSARFTDQRTAASYGAQEAAMVTEVGRIGEQVANAYDDMVTRSAVLERTNQARDRVREYMTNSVYTLKGKDATKAYDLTKTELERIKQELTKDLRPGRETNMFNRAFDAISAGNLDRSINFGAQAAEKYRIDTLNATNETASQDGIANRNDLSAVDFHWQEIKRNTDELTQGQSPEVKEAALRDAEHAYYSRILDAKTSDSPTLALEYFKNNKDRFKPSAVAGIEEALKEKATGEKALANSKIIGSLPLDKQQAELDKITDPKEYQTTKTFLNQRNADRAAVAAIKEESFNNEQVSRFLSSPLAYDFNTPEFFQLKEGTRSLMTKMREKAVKDLEAASGVAPAEKTDFLEYASLLEQHSRGELTTAKIKRSLSKLAFGEAEELTKMVLKDPAGKQPERIISTYQLASQAISGISALTPQIGRMRYPERAVAQRRFYEQVDRSVRALPEDKRNPVEEGKIIDSLLEKVGGRYRFELYYMDRTKSEETEAKAAFRAVPNSLKVYGGKLNYSAKDDVYWVQSGNIYEVYDTTGRSIDKIRVPGRAQ